ncbi:hypothetical protein OG381_38145 [Streptomyces sp. NBC_00490]|uniref:hypothetical protein n=1 Tax=Streptomyces sp. NBC_00490 TaxID=2903657 RepID=UPI002E16E357
MGADLAAFAGATVLGLVCAVLLKRRVLSEHFVRCGTRRVQGAEISVYARPGRC